MTRPTLALCLVVALAAACDSTRHAAPTQPAGTPFSRVHRDLEPSSYSIPIPSTSLTTGGELTAVSTGINMPAYELHYDSIVGTVAVATNGLYTCCNLPAPSPNAAGENVNALGFAFPDNYFQNLLVVIGDYGSNPVLIALSGDNTGPVQTDTFYSGGGGNITIARQGIDGAASGCLGETDTSCTCPSGPCQEYAAGAYTLYSTQVLYVIPAPMPTFTVTATPDTVTSGNSVHFSPVVTPSSFGSHSYYTLYENATWFYNGVQQSCWVGCTMTPSSSGWMVGTIFLNGFNVTDSVYVTVQ